MGWKKFTRNKSKQWCVFLSVEKWIRFYENAENDFTELRRMDMKNGMLKYFATVLGAVCISFSAQAGDYLFYDDFETRDFSAWSCADQNNLDIFNNGAGSISTNQVHSGLYSFKSTLPASGGQSKLLENITSSTDVYTRFYFYVDNAWTQTSIVVLFAVGGGEQVWLRNNSGTLYLQDGDGRQGTHAISKGAWHSIEVRTKAGSGNGIKTVWLDGTQDINATGETISGPFTVVYFGFDNADGTQIGSIYFDDLIISTGAIGSPTANITVRYPNTAARSGMPVDVTLFGQAVNDQLVATVDGSEIYHKTGSITGRERFPVMLSSLNVGDHTFQVQLWNSGGTPKATFSGTLHKYVNGTSTVSIDENNVIHKSGAKYFPIAPFIDGSTEWTNVWLANLSVNTYGWVAGWVDNYAYTKENFKTFIDNLAVPVIGPDGNFTGKGTDLYAANDANAVITVTNYVNYIKNDTNLFMWTWMDEPDIGPGTGHVSPERMLALTQATHNNDGNHPVITNYAGYPFSFINNRRNGWYYPIIPNSTELPSDVNAFDMYPCIYQVDGWTITQLVSMFDEADRCTYGLVPWIAIIEAGVCSENHDCAGYGPTAAQVKMESWQAVIHGIKGISWWGPGGWTDQDSAHWAVLAQFVTDIKHFKDVILSTTSRTVTCNRTTQHNRVDVMVKEDNDSVYIFAARLSDIGEDSDPPINTQLSVSGITGYHEVTVYNESRTLPSMDGVFTDTFNPSEVHVYQIAEGIDGLQLSDVPLKFYLYQNYPNPFNPSTKINYFVSTKENIKLVIYDLLGRQIRTLINGMVTAGPQSVTWDGRDTQGKTVSSGVYFYQLRSETGFTKTQKMILLN
jgi:hypothetical protein